MHKRATSLLVALVALGGFALAIFIPAASAKKSNDSYTQYCEYTEYSQYSQYCEPQTTTTVVNGTTTVITSPGFTVTTSPTTGSTGSNPPPKPVIVVGAGGVDTITIADLKPGLSFKANGVTVTVLAYTTDGVEVDFGGVSVDVPSTALVTVSKDGTVTVTYFIVGGKLVPALRTARAAAFHPVAATGEQEVILPSGKTSNTFGYALTKGVSFGAKTTWKQIAKDFTVEATGTRALRVAAKAAKLSKVPLTVSGNKARTTATVKLAKAEKSFIIKFNVSKLQYTAAEKAYITKHKVKTLSPKFTVSSKAGKKTTTIGFGFSYPV